MEVRVVALKASDEPTSSFPLSTAAAQLEVESNCLLRDLILDVSKAALFCFTLQFQQNMQMGRSAPRDYVDHGQNP